jgi:uncharacterized membrane protein
VVILAFLLLAAVSYTLDHLDGVGFARVRELLKTRVFADSKATSDLLGTIASSIITVTSIINSLLLVALQQSAAILVHDRISRVLPA